MAAPVRIVHYVNQFFAGLGGEEQADAPPQLVEQPVGPGRLLADQVADRGKVVANVVCGDNYFHQDAERARRAILDLVKPLSPDVIVAGPSFAAGRYGLACGEVCLNVKQQLAIPAVAGMHPENPAVPLYREAVYIVPTPERATAMRPAVERMANLAVRLARGEPLGPAEAEGYLPTGRRLNVRHTRPVAERAVDLLLHRLLRDEVKTELRLPTLDPVQPTAPLDPATATIALVSTSGLVPAGNPDRLEGLHATKWLRYSTADKDALQGGEYEAVHWGYEHRYAEADPNRVVPLDAARQLEREGRIKRVLDSYYVTAGVVMPIEQARRFGQEIARELREQGVTGVIFTAT